MQFTKFGFSSRIIIVVVLFPSMPMTIKKRLEHCTVQEDEKVKLEVETSEPSLDVKWRKDNVVLQPGGDMEIHVQGTKHSLSFKKISSADQGYYSCETMDDKTRAKLTVESKYEKIL